VNNQNVEAKTISTSQLVFSHFTQVYGSYMLSQSNPMVSSWLCKVPKQYQSHECNLEIKRTYSMACNEVGLRVWYMEGKQGFES